VRLARPPPGDIRRIGDCCGVESGKVVTVISHGEFCSGRKTIGWYNSPVEATWIPIRLPDGTVSKYAEGMLRPV
jgi:hypothetical protein